MYSDESVCCVRVRMHSDLLSARQTYLSFLATRRHEQSNPARRSNITHDDTPDDVTTADKTQSYGTAGFPDTHIHV